MSTSNTVNVALDQESWQAIMNIVNNACRNSDVAWRRWADQTTEVIQNALNEASRYRFNYQHADDFEEDMIDEAELPDGYESWDEFLEHGRD